MQPETHTELPQENPQEHPKESKRAKRAVKQKAAALTRDDAANFDVIDAVIGIAIFAATIGLIGTQITSAGANLTAFPGATTLLYLVPLILVAVLILKLWKGRGSSSGGGGGQRFTRGRRY